MKITYQEDKDLTLIYCYFLTQEQCIKQNDGGESDKVCELLFDSNDEWLGISFESRFIIEDNFSPSKTYQIIRKKNNWTILFSLNSSIFRRETHGCITDLHNKIYYSGIELILNKGAIKRLSLINEEIFLRKIL